MPSPLPSEPRAGALAIGGGACADLSTQCARVGALAGRDGVEEVACDVSGVGAALEAIDALLRLQLAARRAGAGTRLVRASPELSALIDLCGLAGILPADR